MGIYTEYLDRAFSWEELCAERKAQLKRIAELRKRPAILVIAAALTKPNTPTAIDYDDLLPLSDQLGNLDGDEMDLILETPGGSAEIVEDMVHQIRASVSSLKEYGIMMVSEEGYHHGTTAHRSSFDG